MSDMTQKLPDRPMSVGEYLELTSEVKPDGAIVDAEDDEIDAFGWFFEDDGVFRAWGFDEEKEQWKEIEFDGDSDLRDYPSTGEVTGETRR